MFIKKCIYVNWGNIPHLEFDFGPINLLSGGNGSGKTTSADAIQTVMTAAYDYLFAYNPGQDETTQRGKGGKQVRTLQSYILGCDDGSYARPQPTDGYIALTFYPTQGETSEPFTAVVSARAYLDSAGSKPVARLSELFFLIIPGEQLQLDHFIKEQEDGNKHIVGLDKIYNSLKHEFGPDAVEKYDAKKPYLKRLYGALKGKRESVSEREAMNAARAFSRFMAYKPVKSINDFVANEILEKKDLGEAIRSVSELMKTIHGMESDATHLRNSINILEQTAEKSDGYIQQWINLNVLHYIDTRIQYLNDQQTYLNAKRQQKSLQDEQAANQQERDILEARHQQTRNELIQLEAKRQGYQPLQQKDDLEKLVESNTRLLHDQAPALLDQSNRLNNSFKATDRILALLQQSKIAKDIPRLGQKDFLSTAKTFAQQQDKSTVDFTSLLGRDWVDISPLEAHLEDAVAIQQQANQWQRLLHDKELSADGICVRDKVNSVLFQRQTLSKTLEKQRQQKQAEIESLEGHQATYPYYIKNALDTIRRECPKADPRVLCDYIEVKDEQWQNAIEGYIGGARFSIIVEQEFEAEAISIVRNMPGRDNRARVIQGSKASKDYQRTQLDKDSIVNAMAFSHATAKHYIAASYGSVIRVNSEQELRYTRRGITSNGLGSGSYSMWRCDIADSELVFGQGARERALAAKRGEMDKLLAEYQSIEDQQQQLSSLLNAIDRIGTVSYADRLQQMLNTQRELRDAEGKLEHLDLSDFAELEQKLETLKAQDNEFSQQIENKIERAGSLKTEISDITERCKKLSNQQEVSEKLQEEKEENLRSIVSLWPDFDSEKELEKADKRAEKTRPEILINDLKDTYSSLNGLAHDIEHGVIEHNQHCNLADNIAYMPDYGENHSKAFFKSICDLRRDNDLVHNRLKNNILVEKQEKLTKIKESFNNAFVTHLCHAIYQSINDGKKILENMNHELEHHRFGADRESFHFDWNWVPEFKEYWNFFKEIIDLPNLGDGTTLFEAELSQKSQLVRDRLMQMLLSDDEVRSMRELERISDYRNYRSYEIYKQPEGKAAIALSQYGTGSGGQLETPAYIIRSAAITSAFKFNEGNSHLRMVLVDEAFSKMDETRSREVIKYLTETLGLQLLFIMPTSKSGPFMDLISNQFVFSKCPTTKAIGELNTRVLVDRQRCNSDKIKELWANHRRTVRHQYALDFMEEFQ
ncbi:ATP-binding protein [Alkalimarinus alittae]|uniref:Uncharacterized protein n=1 Tax=Alkalimarinus alittae TaxID=2961619 RepID=A0ABY6N2X8_9ALTE|nr:SbcC/MukB-like Walker B domain-containing protein [Alkalimarinus alittae]UZE96399.1 hypothetical protein NKI27_01240 [Alkalimarinus alittae]